MGPSDLQSSRVGDEPVDVFERATVADRVEALDRPWNDAEVVHDGPEVVKRHRGVGLLSTGDVETGVLELIDGERPIETSMHMWRSAEEFLPRCSAAPRLAPLLRDESATLAQTRQTSEGQYDECRSTTRSNMPAANGSWEEDVAGVVAA